MVPHFELDNRFHNQSDLQQDILELRRLHVLMDNEVLKSYGWNNILLNQRQYPVILYYCESPLIEGNIITSNSASTSLRGIYLYYCLNN